MSNLPLTLLPAEQLVQVPRDMTTGLSALGAGVGHLTMAQVNGHRVAVAQAHRFGDDPPVLVTVVAPVGLTLDDVAAVLLDWVNTGGTFDDLDDDSTVQAFVAEYVVNEGCFGLEKAQVQAAAMADAPVLAYCRQRASAVVASGSAKSRNEGTRFPGATRGRVPRRVAAPTPTGEEAL